MLSWSSEIFYLGKLEQILLVISFGSDCCHDLWYWPFEVDHHVVVISRSVPALSTVPDSSILNIIVWVYCYIVLLILNCCDCICSQVCAIFCWILHFIRYETFKNIPSCLLTPLDLNIFNTVPIFVSIIKFFLKLLL